MHGNLAEIAELQAELDRAREERDEWIARMEMMEDALRRESEKQRQKSDEQAYHEKSKHHYASEKLAHFAERARAFLQREGEGG